MRPLPPTLIVVSLLLSVLAPRWTAFPTAAAGVVLLLLDERKREQAG